MAVAAQFAPVPFARICVTNNHNQREYLRSRDSSVTVRTGAANSSHDWAAFRAIAFPDASYTKFKGHRESSNGFDLLCRSLSLPKTKKKAAGKMVFCSAAMRIVFVAAEVSPWSKTGGLGDVLGGLPPALAARGHRVMTIAPRYDQYKDAWDTGTEIKVKVGSNIETVRLFHTFKRGVDRVFVDHPTFLAKVWGQTGEKIYGPYTGVDYDDNQLRFSLLSQAAIEVPRILSLSSNEYFTGPYGEDVVFVANDWHTAPIPCYLKSNYKPFGKFTKAKVVFCVHNIAYQGRFPFSDFPLLNLADNFQNSFAFRDRNVNPDEGLKMNWMKAAFLEADKLLTVSPNYAKELTEGPEKGVELDDVAREVGIVGIANGMDVEEWDPSQDKYIETKYDVSSVLDVKSTLKEALQAEVGLPVNPAKPLIAFIGRLEEQKGSDILVEAASELLERDLQLVVLGTGKKYLEKQIQELEEKFPTKARAIIRFSVPLAHMITAGADFLLVPSRFEPCGLIQLHAMRYGTPPIVASTGGLVDTVQDGVTGYHVGKHFNVQCETVDPADVKALTETVKNAIDEYNSPKYFSLVKAGMGQDLSWKGPAREWEDVLLNLSMEGNESDQGDQVEKNNFAAPR